MAARPWKPATKHPTHHFTGARGHETLALGAARDGDTGESPRWCNRRDHGEHEPLSNPEIELTRHNRPPQHAQREPRNLCSEARLRASERAAPQLAIDGAHDDGCPHAGRTGFAVTSAAIVRARAAAARRPGRRPRDCNDTFDPGRRSAGAWSPRAERLPVLRERRQSPSRPAQTAGTEVASPASQFFTAAAPAGPRACRCERWGIDVASSAGFRPSGLGTARDQREHRGDEDHSAVFHQDSPGERRR